MNEAPPPAFPASVRATAHAYLDRLDDTYVVDGDDAHHLLRVRRVRAGEVITGADGHGRWRVYEVAAATEGRLELRAASALVHEPRLEPGLSVACALTKGERPELVVQKLTELGVDAVILVRAARSVVRWDDRRESAAMGRLRRVAREAGAQCRRARLPIVDGLVGVDELVGRPGLLLADVGGAPADRLPSPPAGAWLVAVGPEGGFAPDELDAFGAVPRLAVGPHVLRAETAAIAAAAALAGGRVVGARRDEREEW
jgi:16S rRNA (uracil1498-N3)-methyltransferase